MIPLLLSRRPLTQLRVMIGAKLARVLGLAAIFSRLRVLFAAKAALEHRA